MNYLAHAYLSFDDRDILAGNMISDFVKGKSQYDYPRGIYYGIRLHRYIDSFTDDHPVTKELKQVFQPQYRLYSGAFVDIVYDHYLANDTERFTTWGGLLPFTHHIYRQLEKSQSYFPSRFAQMFPYMRDQNWLYYYLENEGIKNSFNGLVRRSRYLKESVIAYDLFLENHQFFKEGYEEFFPDLLAYASQQLEVIRNSPQ